MTRTLQARPLRGLCAGALAGLAAWVLIEKTGWFSALLEDADGISAWSHIYWLQSALGGLYGLVVSGGICISDWTGQTRNVERLRSLALSTVSGLVGGAVGMMVGFWAYNILLPPTASAQADSPSHLVVGLIARSIGWALIGVAIGAGQGIPRRSARVAWLGAVGGFMGGIAGGGFFEAMEIATSNPVLARITGFVFLGAAIGFFLEFVPYILKQAWIQIVQGRGAGNEFPLEKRWTSVGRSETADISLFGNPQIAPIHFLIETNSGASLLRPAHKQNAGSDLAPILVNGAPIDSDLPLVGGETIAVGDVEMRFCLKETSPQTGRSGRRHPDKRSATPVREQPAALKVPRIAYAAGAIEPLRPDEVGHVATSRRIADDGLTGTRLHCIHGPYFDQIFTLATREKLVVGRASDSDIPLANDRSISRTHMAILLISGRHWIEDLRSAYGTFVNDVRLHPSQPLMLRPGDTIRLGDTQLKYE